MITNNRNKVRLTPSEEILINMMYGVLHDVRVATTMGHPVDSIFPRMNEVLGKVEDFDGAMARRIRSEHAIEDYENRRTQ